MGEPQTIDIDRRGERVDELGAEVVSDEGRLRIVPWRGQASRWNEVLKRHAGKGPLRIAISRIGEVRSYAQNRLLWHVYREIMRELRKKAALEGKRCPFRDEDALHDAMKYVVLGLEPVRLGPGDEIEIPRTTTTTLTVEQFSAYLEGVLGFWAKRGIYIEMPGEAA